MVLAAPLAIGFGALGALSARSQNKALAKFAKQGQEQINKQITDVRIKGLDDTLRLSQAAQVEVGRARASLAGTAGLSTSAVVASIAGDVTADSIVLRRNTEAMLDALDAQKDQIVAQAQGQVQNVGTAALSAALGGFQLGLGLDGAIAAVGNQKEMLRIEQGLGDLAEQGSGLDRSRSLMLRGFSDQFFQSAAGRLRSLLEDVSGLRQSVRRFEGP